MLLRVRMRMLMEPGRCTVVDGVTSHPVINMYGVQEFGSIFRVTTNGFALYIQCCARF